MHSTFYRRCFHDHAQRDPRLRAVCGWSRRCARIGWAAVLAFILYPLHERLARRLRATAPGRPASSPADTVPRGRAAVARSAWRSPGRWGDSSPTCAAPPSSPTGAARTACEQLSLIGGAVAWARDNAAVTRCAGARLDDRERADAAASPPPRIGGNVALGVFGTLVGFFMMLFMLFFFLQDGRAMLEASHAPRPGGAAAPCGAAAAPGRRDARRGVRLGRRPRSSRASSSVSASRWSAALAGGVRRARHHRRLPPGRGGLVLIPAVLYLASSGRWGAAIFLACWTAGMWSWRTSCARC